MWLEVREHWDWDLDCREEQKAILARWKVSKIFQECIFMSCPEWASLLNREENKEEELALYFCALKGAFPKNQGGNVPVLHDMGRSLSRARCLCLNCWPRATFEGVLGLLTVGDWTEQRCFTNGTETGGSKVTHWLNMKQRVANISHCPSLSLFWSLQQMQCRDKLISWGKPLFLSF